MTDIEGLLGLGLRSGTLRVGVEGVRVGLQAGDFHCVVVAADATGRVEDKVIRLARGKRVPLITGPTADRLGASIGRPPVMVVGVMERALADAIVQRAPRFGLREE